MKIVHITYAFGLGGIETMLRNIVNWQAELRHDVNLIVINDVINEELYSSLDKRVSFICIGRHSGSKNPIPYFRMNLLLHKINPDVIHLHYSSIANFLYLPSLRRKICVTQHDVCSARNSRYLNECKRIYAISIIVQDDIKEHTGLKSEVVLNGVEVKSINHERHSKNARFRIVQVSRLMHEKKGQHILIKAIRELVERGYENLSLDLIGDGESYDYLRTLVADLRLSKYVNFLGSRDQSYIYTHLCEYDLLVQPSIYEGFGLTVAEAMAAKVPVLVSAIQGPMEIIDNGHCGYYFLNQDPDDCARKIEVFLRGQNEKAMIEKAYQRVCSLYNVEVTANTYLLKYKDFVESGYAAIR